MSRSFKSGLGKLPNGWAQMSPNQRRETRNTLRAIRQVNSYVRHGTPVRVAKVRSAPGAPKKLVFAVNRSGSGSRKKRKTKRKRVKRRKKTKRVKRRKKTKRVKRRKKTKRVKRRKSRRRRR